MEARKNLNLCLVFLFLWQLTGNRVLDSTRVPWFVHVYRVLEDFNQIKKQTDPFGQFLIVVKNRVIINK